VAEESTMLDPKEQQKGGFGAAAARAKERHDLREATKAQAADDASGASAATETPGTTAQPTGSGRTEPTPGNARADKRVERKPGPTDGAG
jgi:hypothetical protein